MKPQFSLLTVIAVVFATAVMAQDPRIGLVAYWPMDELQEGDTETPDLANGYHLTLVNMDASAVVEGHRGNALTFDGFSGFLYRDVEANPSPGLPLSANPQRTIAMWVRGFGAGQNDRRMFSESSTVNNNPLYNLGTANNGNDGTLDLYIRGTNGTVGVNHLRSTGQPLDGDWHHLVVTDNNGSVTVYIDGEVDRTLTYTPQVIDANILSLGAIRRAADSHWFTGELDDVAVWNRILTPAEVVEVMENGFAQPIPAAIAISPTAPHLQGDRVVLTVHAFAGGEEITYQWQRNGANLPGAIERNLVIANLNSETAGAYTVLVNGVATDAFNVGFTADGPAQLTQDLLSWWAGDSLDETTDPPTSPDPYGGHPLHLTNFSASELVPGRFGSAFSFDGFSTHATRLTGFPITTNPEFSISLWVKGEGTGQNDLRVFAESSTTSNTPLFTLGTANNGTTSMRVLIRSDSGAVPVERNTTTPVFDDEWHHIVWSERNGRVRLYIDGEIDGTNFDFNRTGTTFAFNRLTFGGIERAAISHWFNGLIDDAAVWNRALTWTEVQQLRTAGVPAPVVLVPPSFVAHPTPVLTRYEGRTVTMAVQVVGSPPIDFRWFKGDAPVPDATEPELILPDLQVADSGSYTCRVTNPVTTITSNPSVLTVIPITPLVTGRVNCWPLDTTDAMTTPDTIGGQHLSLINMDEFSFSPGVIGNGVTFDGFDDLLRLDRTGGDVPLTTRREYSIAFWVKGFGFGQSDLRIFAEASTQNNNPIFTLGTNTTGEAETMSIFIRSDGGAVPVNHVNTFMPVFDDTWHHVVLTDLEGQIQVYVDGEEDVSVTYARPVSALNTLTLGGIARAAISHRFTGSLDEVCTWERALTADEARTLFTQGPVPTGDLQLLSIERLPADQVRLTFRGIPNVSSYGVQTSPSLALGSWSPNPTATITSLGNDLYQTDLPVPASGQLHYRITSF